MLLEEEEILNREFEEDEVELRLDDLILYCFEHWRSIVISMVICAVIAGGIGMYKNYQKRLEARKSDSEKYTSAALVIDDEVRVEELDKIAHRVALYKQVIEGKEKYMSESVLMNLDSSSVVTKNIQYKFSTVSGNIRNSAQQQENLQLIVKSYESRLANDELYESAAGYLGIRSPYVRELISASDYFPSGTNVYLATSEDLDENITSSAILNVYVKGQTIEYCDSLADYVKKRIESIGEDLNVTTTPYTITLLNETATTTVDNGIINSKTDVLNFIKSTEGSIETLEKELTSDEVDYVEAKSDEELDTLLAVKKEEKEPEFIPLVSKKFIVIGAFLGMCLLGGYWLLKYILSPKIISHFAIEDRFGIKTYVLGDGNGPKSGLSGKFRKLRYRTTHFYTPEELAKIFKAEIETLSEKKEITKVFIASTENFDRANDAFINALRDIMSGSGIEISSGEKIKYDPDMIISTSNADAVIVIENIGKSSNFEISEEIRFINERKTQIIGAVLQ